MKNKLRRSFFLMLVAVHGTVAADERPNIVFMFSDDLTTQAISAYRYGLDLPPTPNIDRIAREGMLFENSFCGNSICTPSRGTVMTGLHSHAKENGIVNLGGALNPDGPSWPKQLHANGFTTAVFGKWHMKTKPSGFDDWGVFSGQGNYYNPEIFSTSGSRRIEGHSTDVVTDLALNWLDRRDRSKPFLLMVQHKAPHRNWKPSLKELELYRDITFPEPPSLFDNYAGRTAAKSHKMGIDQHMRLASDLMLFQTEDDLRVIDRMTSDQRAKYVEAFEAENSAFKQNPPQGKELVRWKYQRYMKNYLRCVAGVDRNVGRVLDRLDELGLSDNTIVVYSADQGFYLGEHGWFDKRWAYEESMRMPLIIRWPGKIKAGSRCQAMVQNIDYAPTMLAAAGLKPNWKVHGVSLMPLIENAGAKPNDWRDTLYYRYVDRGHGVAAHSAIRTEEHKLLYFDAPRNEQERNNRWELFDLKNDPNEMHNLANSPEHQATLAMLQNRFQQVRKYYGDTDDSIWKRGRKRRFARDAYIRPR